jgi:hypothetical protein
VTRKAKLGVRVWVLVGGGEAELEEEEGGWAEGEASDARLERRDEISDGVLKAGGGSFGECALRTKGRKENRVRRGLKKRGRRMEVYRV